MKLSRKSIRYKLAVASHLGTIPNIFTVYSYLHDRFECPEYYISTDKCWFWINLFSYYIFQPYICVLAGVIIIYHFLLAPIFVIFAMLYDFNLFFTTMNDTSISSIGFGILIIYLILAVLILGKIGLSKFNERTHINYRKSYIMDKWDKFVSWKESKCTKIEFED